MDTPGNSFHANKKLPLKNAALAALQPFAELHMQAAVCKKTPNLEKEKSPKQVAASPPLHFSGFCFIFPPSVLKLTLQKPHDLETKPVLVWRLVLILTTVTEGFSFALESK